MSQVPGVTAAHAIITDRCRDVQGGDLEAFDEAVRRARETYQCMLPNWPKGQGIKLHVVLSVEWPRPEVPPAA